MLGIPKAEGELRSSAVSPCFNQHSFIVADVLIRKGLIVDGAGTPWYRADVGVREGRFAAIGKLERAEAESVVDAEGLAVAPGFIDIHVHSDYTLLADPKGESAVAQGITTDFNGQCGISPAPALEGAIDPIKRSLQEYGLELSWSTVSEYLDHLELLKPSINVATLVGHGAIREYFTFLGNKGVNKEVKRGSRED
jgi:N-acyl-D-amino-acid deacylase